jgi:hypothetical protein
MNPDKSKFSLPPIKSLTITYKAQDNGFKIVSDEVLADGKAIHRTYSAKCDGKDYPVTAPDADTFSCRRPNPKTTEYVMKKNFRKVMLRSLHGESLFPSGGFLFSAPRCEDQELITNCDKFRHRKKIGFQSILALGRCFPG